MKIQGDPLFYCTRCKTPTKLSRLFPFNHRDIACEKCCGGEARGWHPFGFQNGQLAQQYVDSGFIIPVPMEQKKSEV